jgi:hypothetical protein
MASSAAALLPIAVVTAIANATTAALSSSLVAPAAAPLAPLHPAAAALAPGGGGLGLGLSVSGFLGLFFLGAISALERLGIFDSAATPIAGASGGSLVGMSACLGVPPETALAIARDMTRLCLPRGSCAGFLDAPVRRMLNATLAAAVAGTGEMPIESLTSPDGFGGWGSGGNFSAVPRERALLASSAAAALRASASPEYWRIADRLVKERCGGGRMNIMISQLVKSTGAGAGAGGGRPAEAGVDVLGALLGASSSSTSNSNVTLAVVGTNSTAALTSSALSLLPDPLSGEDAADAAARAADAALLGSNNVTTAAATAAAAAANATALGAAARAVRARPSEFGLIALAPLAGGAVAPTQTRGAIAAAPTQQGQAPAPSPPPRAHWAALSLSDFSSASDLVDAAAGSSFIPVYSGPSITTLSRGLPVADGMLVNPLPCPPGVGYCVRISAAMPGESLVQGTRPILAPDIAPGLRIPFKQTVRQWQARALSAPTAAVSQSLVWLGEREAEAWAVEVGLVTEERVAELRARSEAVAAAAAQGAQAAVAQAAGGGGAAARAATVAAKVAAADAVLDDADGDAAAKASAAAAAAATAAVPLPGRAPGVPVAKDQAGGAAVVEGAKGLEGGATGAATTTTPALVPPTSEKQQPRAPLLMRKLLRDRSD